MIFALKPYNIDIIVVFVIILMVILGYKKGFGVRLFDFLASIGAIILSFILSQPISQIYHLYYIEGIFQFIGDFMNRLILFMLCFIIIKVVFSFIGHFVKPVIQSLFNHIKLMKMFDRLLGVLLSIVESFIFIYLALIMVVSPFVEGGQKCINDTIIARQIISIVPYYSEEVMAMTNNFELMSSIIDSSLQYDGQDASTIYTVSLIFNNSYDHRFISYEQLVDHVKNYYLPLEPVIMNKNQYHEVQKLLDKVKKDVDTQAIYNKITVRE